MKRSPARRRSTGNHSLPLSGIGGGSANFGFHLVFFPAAYFLPGERFSVVAVVAWITAIERWNLNLFPYPSFT